MATEKFRPRYEWIATIDEIKSALSILTGPLPTTLPNRSDKIDNVVVGVVSDASSEAPVKKCLARCSSAS